MKNKIKTKYMIRITIFLIGIVGGMILNYAVFAKDFYIYKTRQNMVENFRELSRMNLEKMGAKETRVLDDLVSQGFVVDVFNDERILYTSSRKRNLNLRPDSFGVLNVENYKENPETVINDNHIELMGKVKKSGNTVYIRTTLNIKSLAGSVELMSRFMLVEMVVALILGMIFGFYQAHRTIRPIEELGKMAQKMKNGERNYGTGYQFTNDEIGQLKDRIEEMYEQINSKLLEEKNYNYLLSSQYQDLMEMDERKQNFVRMATHELKTPLAIVSSQVEMLNIDYPDAMEEYYDSIMEEIGKMSKMIRELLNISMVDEIESNIQFEKRNLSALLKKEEKKYVSWMNRKHIRCHFEIEPDIIMTMNQEMLGQAFNNFMRNAYEHANEGTEVKVSLRKKDNRIFLSVYNEGEQIPEEHMEDIWKKLFSKKSGNASANIGVGLYIVKEITKKHHGICYAENKKGGVEFTMEFPAE
ncbi:MAG: HAMP domain-containing histidine kinase [Eubacterium sp.]|nr:HAMP domain-containing histidine kinase [Eubacterium sp.]